MNNSAKDMLEKIGLSKSYSIIENQRREIDRLSSFNEDRLKFVLEANKRLWTIGQNNSAGREEDVHIEDPIHKQVTIEEEIAPIFYHPTVQRLAHIKQLSFSYLTFPTATHSRLSHSLGVCKNAELVLGRILQRGVLYQRTGTPAQIPLSELQKRDLLIKTKVAALLHDIGHGPFGHGLDQYLVTSDADDPVPDKVHGIEIIKRYLGEVIEGCGVNPNEVIAILQKNTQGSLAEYDNLAKEIIDSPLDVDRMDYLVRDAHLTGLSLGTVNVEALISRMVPFVETDESTNQRLIVLVFHPSAIPYITHLLYARDSMYLNCYEHPRKLIAEKMLMRAVEDFRSRHSVDVDDLILLTDEQLMRLLLEHSKEDDVSFKYAFALMRNALFEEVYAIYPKARELWERKHQSKSETKPAVPSDVLDPRNRSIGAVTASASTGSATAPPKPSEAVQDWRKKRLSYKRKFDSRPKEFEDDIARLCGIEDSERWKLLVTVPSEGMYQRKDDQIRILTFKNGVYGYDTWNELTGSWEDVLEQIGSERYCFRVFVSPDLADKKALIESVAKDYMTEQRTSVS